RVQADRPRDGAARPGQRPADGRAGVAGHSEPVWPTSRPGGGDREPVLGVTELQQRCDGTPTGLRALRRPRCNDLDPLKRFRVVPVTPVQQVSEPVWLTGRSGGGDRAPVLAVTGKQRCDGTPTGLRALWPANCNDLDPL